MSLSQFGRVNDGCREVGKVFFCIIVAQLNAQVGIALLVVLARISLLEAIHHELGINVVNIAKRTHIIQMSIEVHYLIVSRTADVLHTRLLVFLELGQSNDGFLAIIVTPCRSIGSKIVVV